MPPAAGTGLVVYPVGAAGGVQPVVPAFLPVKDAELPGGVIAAFSPLPDADRAQSQARLDRLGIKEKRVRVFSLCEIHFSVRGAFPRDSRGALSWDWAETQRRWVKA
jgi:hypothetical protein